MKTLIPIIGLILCIGCGTPRGNQAVPSSEYRIPTPSGTASAVLPKDSNLESFHYERTGSNVVVDIKGLKAANSPEVVAQSWVGVLASIQAQQAAANARFEMLMQFMMFGANKAGNYFGLPTTPTTSTNR